MLKDQEFCDVCKMAKATVLPFKMKSENDYEDVQPGEVVHGDYCDPMKVKGKHGMEVGFWTYIDERTSRVVVVFKSQGKKQDDAFVNLVTISISLTKERAS